jgi:hypothetical protein
VNIDRIGLDFQIIEDPYDEHERELLRIIEGIHREAKERAEPYIKALAWSRSHKLPRYVLMPKHPEIAPQPPPVV